MSTENQPSGRTLDADFIQQLQTEVGVWEEEDLITQEQSYAILASYGASEALEASRSMNGRLIAIIATLGAVLVGVGVILWVASNWQDVSRFGKLVLIVLVLVASFGSGYWLKYERDFPRVGGALVLIGTFLFGAAIFLVAQMYHMNVEDPNLLTWWFLGTIPIAYLTRSRAILTLAIFIALGAVGYRASFWLSRSGDLVGLLSFTSLYMVLGVLVYALGTIHSSFQQSRLFTAPYLNIGLVTVFVPLYVLSFRFLYEFSGSGGPGQDYYRLFLIPFSVIVATTAVALAGSFAFAYRNKLWFAALRFELAAGVIMVVIAYGILLIRLDSGAIFYTILFNLLLFGLSVGVIFLGNMKREGSLINVGLVFFSISLATRYFDLSWDLLDRSLFFISGGLVLLAIGIFMERVRRRLIRRIVTEKV